MDHTCSPSTWKIESEKLLVQGLLVQVFISSSFPIKSVPQNLCDLCLRSFLEKDGRARDRSKHLLCMSKRPMIDSSVLISGIMPFQV